MTSCGRASFARSSPYPKGWLLESHVLYRIISLPYVQYCIHVVVYVLVYLL
jgi:hypothetical protein